MGLYSLWDTAKVVIPKEEFFRVWRKKDTKRAYEICNEVRSKLDLPDMPEQMFLHNDVFNSEYNIAYGQFVGACCWTGVRKNYKYKNRSKKNGNSQGVPVVPTE